MKTHATIITGLLFILIVSLNGCGDTHSGKELRVGVPAMAGMDAAKLERIDEVITRAIREEKLPGAVVLVGRKGYVVYRKAYGLSQINPVPETMSVHTIFDMASVTKPVATATSVMILAEEGKLRLMDRVDSYIPEYTAYSDSDGHRGYPIRIYHLLTHTSGLPSYTDAAALKERYGEPCPDSLIIHIAEIRKNNPPGEHFDYSCLGFITLAEIIHRVSGMTIDEFSRKRIFEPLGMKRTTFCPPEALIPDIAPTEVFDDGPLMGSVHDPLAQLMDGKSGNAGLFSTADDLAIFAQMMLNGGKYGNTRILSPMTVKTMTTVPHRVEFSGRGLGWDLYSAYSSNRGDIFPGGSYGHTGFTGTSIWIDPHSETFVILLSNRVHVPEGDVIRLRSLVANIVAGSIYCD